MFFDSLFFKVVILECNNKRIETGLLHFTEMEGKYSFP
jgi:hypothetical protein